MVPGGVYPIAPDVVVINSIFCIKFMATVFFWLIFSLLVMKLLWNIFVVIFGEIKFRKNKKTDHYVIMNFHYEFLLLLFLMCYASLINVGYFSNNLGKLLSICVLLIFVCYSILIIFQKFFLDKK